MYDFDHQLFLSLNFDGGPVVDRLMLTVSGSSGGAADGATSSSSRC